MILWKGRTLPRIQHRCLCVARLSSTRTARVLRSMEYLMIASQGRHCALSRWRRVATTTARAKSAKKAARSAYVERSVSGTLATARRLRRRTSNKRPFIYSSAEVKTASSGETAPSSHVHSVSRKVDTWCLGSSGTSTECWLRHTSLATWSVSLVDVKPAHREGRSLKRNLYSVNLNLYTASRYLTSEPLG